MQSAPLIHYDEFSQYSGGCKIDDSGFEVRTMEHPNFGRWRERFLDLGHIRVHENRADFNQEVHVLFDDGSLKRSVHHCASLEGEMAANFSDYNLSAHLQHGSFHSLYLPGDAYFLGMKSQLVNFHMEIDREYYASLLTESEAWSDSLREKILGDEMYYPGEFRLSGQMIQTIHAIFNSGLLGCLKRLLVEAKVHELIALQLHRTSGAVASAKESRSKGDVFFAVKDYLAKTYLTDHSLKSIARHFGLNEFVLKKGFREHFGTTVFDYILSRRLEHGQMLLLNTDQSIQQISSSVGYSYPHHFSVAFKRKFGVTPKEMRNEKQ